MYMGNMLPIFQTITLNSINKVSERQSIPSYDTTLSLFDNNLIGNIVNPSVHASKIYYFEILDKDTEIMLGEMPVGTIYRINNMTIFDISIGPDKEFVIRPLKQIELIKTSKEWTYWKE